MFPPSDSKSVQEDFFGISKKRDLRGGAGRRIRTDDLLITNQLLYQLSYAGIYEGKYPLMRPPRVAFYTPFLYGYL
jgi:hypothetical protein